MHTDDETLEFHIDHPTNWRLTGRGIVVRGWGFTRDGRPLAAVRLVSPGVVLPGITCLPRPDVRAALPQAPNANTGFEIRGILPVGRYPLRIEAQPAMGEWQTIAEHEATITRSWPPAWLGGGSARDLMMFQLPAHMRHTARPVTPDCFPKRSDSLPRPGLVIVTPTYRHASSLEETILSVLNQPEVRCDYVVQDGGSTDGSVEIIRSHERRLHAWESIADRGQSDAIAKGFAKTSGKPTDIMAWINSDDFYMPGALRFVAEYFARHPEVDVVYGHRVVVNREGQEIARWYLPKHDPEVLRLNDFVPQETMFWRRQIWDEVGGIDTSFQFAMDWDLLLRFQEAGAKIVRVPYFLACFRVHPQQKTSALISTQGQAEIDRLRLRTFGRNISPEDLLNSKPLQRYLRRSAWIEQLWRWGIRAR